jgi:transposase-like protein
VTVGTIFEGSRIPLNKWLYAIYMMCTSKKGISAHQLHRELDITYKSAWFLCHRIRHAMTAEPLAAMLAGKVEADETYVGGKKKGSGAGGPTAGGNKTIVFTLVQRGGNAKSFRVEDVKKSTLQEIIREHVHPDTIIYTDQHRSYGGVEKPVLDDDENQIHPGFKAHQSVDHSIGEYSRGDAFTNTAESFFSLFKRGVVGAFHHVSPEHIHRYLTEFDFRWNRRKDDDGERFVDAILSGEGKRLFYRVPASLAEGNPA